MFRFFDLDASLSVSWRKGLPHWSQAGVSTFITWRTADSMPEEVLDTWRRMGNRRKRTNGTLSTQWDEALDAGHGACLLRRSELSKIVAESLLHFDGVRYVMEAFVVMANHVHLLASFPSEDAMLAQCESWKHYTATRINRMTGNQGQRFWQKDAFDHLVRDEKRFEALKVYISENPVKAGLKRGEYRVYMK